MPHFLNFAPTPPMGWNSWDCFATTVTEAQTLAQAEVMARDLKPFGWRLITVDIQWYEPNAVSFDYRANAELHIDPYGRLQPAPNRFPSGFKSLGQKLHKMGLTFGIHLLRGIPRQAVRENTAVLGTNHRAQDIANTASTCPWNPDMYGVDMSRPGAQEYYNSVFRQFAEWGVDFVKVDDISRPYHDHEKEIEAIRHAIDSSGRKMVLSLSPGETPLTAAKHVSRHANLWRISDDFWDEWRLLKDQFERLNRWSAHAHGGHWPDADMLPLGIIRFKDRTRFSRDEQLTMMNLWAIARSPLILGCDLTQLDDWTRSLLTNKELIRINQKGHGQRQLSNQNGAIIWESHGRKGERFVGLFNTTDEPLSVAYPGTVRSATNIWTNTVTTKLEADLPPHGSALFVVR